MLLSAEVWHVICVLKWNEHRSHSPFAAASMIENSPQVYAHVVDFACENFLGWPVPFFFLKENSLMMCVFFPSCLVNIML